MVQEVRRIMLSADELIAAFESHRRATPDFLPDGRVIDCVPANNGVLVTVQTKENPNTKSEFLMKNDDAVVPLIRFCLENHIMLPRDGQKTLYVKDGVASLYVVFNLPIDVSKYLPPTPVGRSHSFTPADIMKEAARV